MRTIILLLALEFCLSSNSFSQKHRYSFSDKYDVESHVKLIVYTSDGFIEVRPSKGDFIEVFYIVEKGKNFLKISRDEMDKNYILEVDQTEGLLNISLRRRNENKFEVERDRYNVSCEIYVPDSTACDLTSGEGRILLENLNANQKCITINGDVKIHDIHGSVYASTTLGMMKIENINGGVDLITNNGDIKIDHVLGAITATTSEGDIRFSDCEGSISSQTTFGDIRGNMNKLQSHLKLVTRNGDLTVRIPKDTGLDMKIKGQELHVPDLVLPVEITKNQIFGKANGGGIPVELLTTSGSATLLFN